MGNIGETKLRRILTATALTKQIAWHLHRKGTYLGILIHSDSPNLSTFSFVNVSCCTVWNLFLKDEILQNFLPLGGPTFKFGRRSFTALVAPHLNQLYTQVQLVKTCFKPKLLLYYTVVSLLLTLFSLLQGTPTFVTAWRAPRDWLRGSSYHIVSNPRLLLFNELL